MLSPAIRMASDYNRGLLPPVRWAHVLIALVRHAWRVTFGGSWWGRLLVWPAVLGIIGFVVVHPFDAAIATAASNWAATLSGDLRRELHAWQQFGQGFAIVITAIGLWLLEPARRRRLLDFALAVGIAQVVSQSAKMLVGRPRPRPEFSDPSTFLGPWGQYPIRLSDGSTKLVHAWDIRAGATTDLWSMPSSHTLFAAMLACVLGALYPRLTPLLVGLVAIVAMGRVVFDAHWPTDVVVGAAAGYAIGATVMHTYAGVRLLDWIWRTFINRNALPALPALREFERARAALGSVQG